MKKHKGFTLVELLVVIAIIALLLSILMPSLNKARQSARTVVCQSNVKQWGVIFMMYGNDNNLSMPMGWNNPADWGGYKGMWMSALRKYYTNRKICLCPSTTRFRSDGPSAFYASTDKSIAWGVFGKNGYGIPVSSEAGDYGSYGINAWAHNPPDSLVGPGKFTPGPTTLYWRKVDVSRGNTIPLFADAIWDGAAPIHTDLAPRIEGAQEMYSGMSNFSIPRHQGSQTPVNVVFLDTSVRKVGLKELWTLKWHKQFNTSYAHAWPAWMNKYK